MATTQVSTSLRQFTPGMGYITRYIAPLALPGSVPVDWWREAVRRQQAAIISRDTIISYMTSTPWRIVPKNPDDVGVYDEEIKYYTELIRASDGGYQYHLDLVLQDALDTPIGGCTELVREGDVPGGKVLAYKHMDAATLTPTLFDDYPIVQRPQGFWTGSAEPVWFPGHAVARMGWSPRPELMKSGWFMAPPEKIYLALSMLVRGDQYYANMLSDTPEAGLLDLMDMAEDVALGWLDSWKDLLGGTDPFKIPVLYEHEQPAKFIPFGRPPEEIIYDKTTLKYAAFCAAGYGLTLADIGIMVENQSLAGAIRGERRSLKNGFSTAKTKVKSYYEVMLPPYLVFDYVERDDEMLVAKGRARLANSMAMRNLTEGGILTEEDAQQQLVADGLITIPVQSAPGAKPKTQIVSPTHVVAKQLQSPVPPSEGGNGEITAKSLAGASEVVRSHFAKYVPEDVVVDEPELIENLVKAIEDPESDDPDILEVRSDVKDFLGESYSEKALSSVLPFGIRASLSGLGIDGDKILEVYLKEEA